MYCFPHRLSKGCRGTPSISFPSFPSFSYYSDIILSSSLLSPYLSKDGIRYVSSFSLPSSDTSDSVPSFSSAPLSYSTNEIPPRWIRSAPSSPPSVQPPFVRSTPKQRVSRPYTHPSKFLPTRYLSVQKTSVQSGSDSLPLSLSPPPSSSPFVASSSPSSPVSPPLSVPYGSSSSSFPASSSFPTVPSSSSSVRLQAARMDHQGILHQEHYMFIETSYIPHYAVHITYTNDVLAVNRWIRQHIPSVPLSFSSSPSSTSFLSNNTKVRYIGLDCEWRANTRPGDENRLAVVQLATEKAVLVFQTSCAIVPESSLLSIEDLRYVIANESLVRNANPHDLPIPIEFARILFDPTVIFVGVGVKNDYQKCIKDFKIDTLNLPDLLQRLRLPAGVLYSSSSTQPTGSNTYPSSSNPAVDVSSTVFPVVLDRTYAERRVIEMSEKYFAEKRLKALEGGGIGLKSIGTTVLGISGWAAKGEKAHIHRQWELPLSLSQLRYAALDAWVSKVAYEVIETHGRRLPREEELARRHSKKLALTIIPRILDFSILRALQHSIETENDHLPVELKLKDITSDMSLEPYLPYYSSIYLKAAASAPVTVFDREYSQRFEVTTTTTPTTTTIATTVSSVSPSLTTTVSSVSPSLTTAVSSYPTLIDNHNKLLYMKARNLIINAMREGYSLLSLPGRIATSASSLREDYALAMRDPPIIHIVENSLHWFIKGTLSSPPVGGSGHLRARRPFPTHRRLRRIGRPSPESRFEPDCHSYLQLSRSPEDKESTIILRTKKQLILKQIKNERKYERSLQKVPNSHTNNSDEGIDDNETNPCRTVASSSDVNENSGSINPSTNNDEGNSLMNEKYLPMVTNNRSDSIVLSSYSNWPMSGLLHAARIATHKAALTVSSVLSSSSLSSASSAIGTMVQQIQPVSKLSLMDSNLPLALSTVTIFPPVVPFTYVKVYSSSSSSSAASPQNSSSTAVPSTTPSKSTVQVQVPSTPHVRLISLPYDYFLCSSTVGILTAEILHYQQQFALSFKTTTVNDSGTTSTKDDSPTEKSRTVPKFVSNTNGSGTNRSSKETVHLPTNYGNKHSTLEYLMDPWL